jgi:two-component system, OmpR family, response regulator
MSARILIVEDNPDSCAYLARLLVLKGYTVLTARDGLEALHEVKDFNPDAIVSDIMMPKVDGIQMVKTLRSTPNYRDLPVLVISAHGSGNLLEALKAGANDAMRKPLNLDLFFKSLETLINPQPSDYI